MIEIKNKTNCSGCNACASICPKQCISMQEDEEGFLYPKVDLNTCIKCNLCTKICPILNKKINKEEKLPKTYGAYNLDETARKLSSSGGIFTLLAEQIIDDGGVVFGVGLSKDFKVVNKYIERKEDIEELRESKYVQSKVGDSFKQVKDFLNQGRKVLFSGTPCQVAGLLAYLGKPYDNLFTQDLICHGVPSPAVWEAYKEYKEKQNAGKLSKVRFRCKEESWTKYVFYMEFDNNKIYKKTFYKDPMFKMFFRHFSLRPACYDCKFKGINRVADITLADFWGVKKSYPELFDDKGTSLVLVHSKKGQQLFDNAKQKMKYQEVELNKAISHNKTVVKSSSKPLRRKAFFKDLKSKPFKYLILKYAILTP